MAQRNPQNVSFQIQPLETDEPSPPYEVMNNEKMSGNVSSMRAAIGSQVPDEEAARQIAEADLNKPQKQVITDTFLELEN